jgi:hypothetical protein
MRSYKRNIPTRLIFATVLIIASFLSAVFLSTAANRTELFWGARTVLTPGMTISSSDLEPRRVALFTAGGRYLRATNGIVKFVVIGTIGAGELIPVRAISFDSGALGKSAVPISVQSSDVPLNLLPGELVNVYQVGDSHLASTSLVPSEILNRVFILGINKKGENLGANVSLTLSVRKSEILNLLRATSSGRLVIVRING